jgi:hypothetical protein
MKPRQTPTFVPLNNSLSKEAHAIDLGDAVIVASLLNPTEQVVLFWEVPEQSVGGHFGL